MDRLLLRLVASSVSLSLLLQELNLLRRITIFKMVEIIASVIVRYY